MQINNNDGRDPILGAIQNYRDGLAAYNSKAEFASTSEDEDALIAETYGPPMEVLDNWTAPATTFEGALEALRLARQEMHDFENSFTTKSLFAAAMAYLEGSGPRSK